MCSTLSLLEVLVQPYRRGKEELVNQFYGLLTTYPGLTWVTLSTEIADIAARLRAHHRLKTPDAIVLATAIEAPCSKLQGIFEVQGSEEAQFPCCSQCTFTPERPGSSGTMSRWRASPPSTCCSWIANQNSLVQIKANGSRK
ncbi:MAG: PIN domain-containing protein [Nitrospirae bacterium]|nr:PIN domain-containing protein [Nitrospirota bacterium]